MTNQPKPTSWTKEELRLGILQMLYLAQQKSERASGKMLMDSLNPILFQMQDALNWLREQQLVEIYDVGFVITDAGRDYLQGLDPGGMTPTDGSPVPRRPLPMVGGNSVALPLPDETLQKEDS
jgi:hypothetical protein